MREREKEEKEKETKKGRTELPVCSFHIGVSKKGGAREREENMSRKPRKKKS